MITLIIGRSASGKDTLATLITENSPLQAVISYTTRPRRGQGENTHVFVADEYYQKRKGDVVAHTVINNYHYFATRESVLSSSLYVIDPEGAMELMRNLPNVAFQIVYLTADATDRRCRAILRADDPEAAADIFDARDADEDARFTEFEQNIETSSDELAGPFPANLAQIHVFENDFQMRTLEDIAQRVIASHLAHDSVHDLIRNVLDFHQSPAIDYSRTENAVDFYDLHIISKQDHFDPVPFDIFVEIVLNSSDWMNHFLKCALGDHILINEETSDDDA